MADAVNALLYLAEGNPKKAAISGAAAVGLNGKVGKKLAKVIKGKTKSAKIGQKIIDKVKKANKVAQKLDAGRKIAKVLPAGDRRIVKNSTPKPN